MLVDKISHLLRACADELPPFPPTELYNERWLLRLALDWFATHDTIDHSHALSFASEARWFAEGQLPTVFKKRYAGDQLAEKRMRTDGVIGHFVLDIKDTKTALDLRADAQQFVVLEAQLFSPLTQGTKNARYFDQAARTVACMAEALNCANRYPMDMTQLGFLVIAPHIQIERGTFADYLSRESLRHKVKQRVKAYDDKKMKQWYSEWAEPALEQLTLDALSWENVIAYIGAHDTVTGPVLHDFYARCVELNVM